MSLVPFSNVLLISGLYLVTCVNSHSWVECTDYDMSEDLHSSSFNNEFYDSSCSGYARDRKYWSWHSFFGENSGMDYKLSSGTSNMCERSIGNPSNTYSDTYDSSYPMASYTVGETKRLIWPAKNHAGYECFTDQLDNAMQLFVNLNTNPTSDLGVTYQSSPTVNGWTLVIDWHAEYTAATGNEFPLASCTDGDCSVQSFKGIDDVPFQNCPNFCGNTDVAVCYGDFTVPDIFPADGYYTFLWYWEFKSNEIYSHCFEVYVDGTQAAANTPNPTTAEPTARPTGNPTDQPTDRPSTQPTNRPTENPTDKPSNNPVEPGEDPMTEFPTPQPTPRPTDTPTTRPTNNPTTQTTETMTQTTSLQTQTQTETQTETTNNDSNNNNSGGDSDSDDETPITQTWYLITIPICLTNAQYDYDTLISSLEGLFTDAIYDNNQYGVTTVSTDDTNDEFNVTIEIDSYYPIDVGIAIQDGSICNAVATAFGTDATCDHCDDFAIQSQTTELVSDNSGNNNDNEGESNGDGNNGGGGGLSEDMLIWIILGLIGVIILFIIGVLVYCCIKRKSGGSNVNSKGSHVPQTSAQMMGSVAIAHSTHDATHTQAISPVMEENDGGYGGPNPSNYNNNTYSTNSAYNGYNGQAQQQPAGGARRPPRPPPRPPKRY